MVVSVICRSFLQNIKKINFDSVRDGGHFTGLPFLLTTRQEQAGAELSGLLSNIMSVYETNVASGTAAHCTEQCPGKGGLDIGCLDN